MSGAPDDEADGLADTAATAAGPTSIPVTTVLAEGTAIDRYVIERRLGAGAMGVVYAARDPELDRPVAIKLLKTAGDDDELRARLLREAQALARVDHTNAVSVYDVGTHAGHVFIAMELVRGDTLRAWLSRPRTTGEILAMMIGAGRGLAAAHAAGLVHRDFKPDNVLVGDDGVPRVTDFGLARAAGMPGDDAGRVGSDPAATGTPLTSTLTATGSLLGTPVYAAPEQLAGDRAGPLADQFSFCVSAYEALYGARPFVAASLGELVSRIGAGPPPAPPPGRRIPRRVHRALLRGLSPRPEDRFASMDALLAALAPHPRRWPWVVAAAAVVGIPIAVVLALPGSAPAPRCRSADERLAGVWDADARAKVTAAFAAFESFAAVGPKLVARFDGYADRWRAGWRDACAATEQSAETLDRRVGCLEAARASLAAVVRTVADADLTVAAGAFELLDQLREVDHCADLQLLAGTAAPPRQQRADVEHVEQQLEVALSLANTSRAAPAHAAVEPALAEARRLGYKPLVARALLVAGTIDRVDSRLADAEAKVRESSRVALAINDKALIAESLLELATIRGMQGDLDGQDDTLGLAAGAIDAIGHPVEDLQIKQEVAVAVLRSSQGRHPDALASLDRAIALLEGQLPRDDLSLSRILTARGQTLDYLGRHDEAAIAFDRALAMVMEVAGPLHPATAMALSASAANRQARRQYAEAIDLVQRAHAVLSATLGPDDPATIETERQLAVAALELGDYSAAKQRYEHVLAVGLREDPRSDDALEGRFGIAMTLIRTGKPDEAIERLTELRADMAAVAGADSPRVAYADALLGDARLAQGQPEEAIALFARADAVFVAAFGPDAMDRARTRGGRGRALLAQGHAAEALAELQAARHLLEHEGEPYQSAVLDLALADARWRTGDHAGARAAVAAAVADLDALTPTASPTLRAEIAAWQRAH